jgi:hypothetical protein
MAIICVRGETRASQVAIIYVKMRASQVTILVMEVRWKASQVNDVIANFSEVGSE